MQCHSPDIPIQIISTSNVSSPARKSSKKTFANKFGKSISSFKSSMTRAFNPQFTSTDNLQSSNLLTDGLKVLHDEIRVLKQLVDRKEMLLNHVTKTSYEDRLKYEKENFELKQQIEQLIDENMQLKARYHQSDI